MTEMCLKEVQALCTLILKDVHDFCVLNRLNYSLAYGTLIGAIRHKGFVPWDDDIDIVMPRPDFDKFCTSYKSNVFELVSPEDSDSYITFARVCDNRRSLVVSRGPWCEKRRGVWIDIFPLDGLPSRIQDFKDEVVSVYKYGRIEAHLRTGKLFHDYKILTSKQLFLCFIKKLLYCRKNIRKVKNEHIVLLKSNPFDVSEYCGQLCCIDNPEKEHNPKSDFSSYSLMPFEKYEFYVMNGYHNVLKRYYGDYLTLPPVESQHPDLFNKYYKL